MGRLLPGATRREYAIRVIDLVECFAAPGSYGSVGHKLLHHLQPVGFTAPFDHLPVLDPDDVDPGVLHSGAATPSSSPVVGADRLPAGSDAVYQFPPALLVWVAVMLVIFQTPSSRIRF